MRIAHLSDLHVLSPGSMQWRSFAFNKRLTGYATILFHRGRVFRRDFLDAVLAAAGRESDHVVITGDITNLALESEYQVASRMIEALAGNVEVTIVPGNHDLYVPSVQRDGRFARYFAPYGISDLPDLAVDVPAGRFPFVHLRGPVAIIGLSSGVPRPPFVSAGYLGRRQIDALTRILAHPEVARRTPVLLVHHEPIDHRFRVEQLRSGLTDARSFREALGNVSRGLVLFGHLHVRKHVVLQTAAGRVDLVCATSAALDSANDDARAGYNTYEIDDTGRIEAIDTCVLAEDGRTMRRLALGGK